MEKIFSFIKKNMVIVILIILVVLMMCQPRKSKIKEKFAVKKGKPYCSFTKKECKRWASKNDYQDDKFMEYSKNEDGNESVKSGCSTDNTFVYFNDNEHDGSDSTTNCLNDPPPSSYLYKNNKNQYIFATCSKCTINDMDKKYYCNDEKNTNEIYRRPCFTSKDFNSVKDDFVKCFTGNKKSCDSTFNKLLKKDINEKSLKSILDEAFKEELENRKGKSIHSKKNIQQFSDKKDGYGERLRIAFDEILKLKDKHLDILNKESIDLDERRSLNYNVYLNICVNAYKNALEDSTKDFYNKSLLTQDEFVNITNPDSENQMSTKDIRNKIFIKEDLDQLKQKKKDINAITVNVINNLKDKGILELIFGDKQDKFIKDMEELLNIKIRLVQKFTNGVSYDKKGNLQEHQGAGMANGSYLITALTKHQHLSLGQVNQLRKLMLEAFKVKSNRPFFSFYYENFESVADMLVKQNRLSEILPNMLKCIDLSKNGQFDLAFEQYILTARQAYQICKDMGMDTKDLEDKFDKLDGTINQLPEPNNLFVENGFREALKSC
jgi:hypothetical protein